MKQVAGKLRLELAQYRELAAFAQFGSDLDASTKAQLDRGERLTEMLKQPQYSPLKVEEQVVCLYAGINGYFKRLAVHDVPAFQDALLHYVHGNYANVLASIRDTKKLEEDTEKTLQQAILECIDVFGATRELLPEEA